MSYKSNLKGQVESLTEVKEFPEKLLILSPEEKLELLQILEENRIPAACYKAQRGKTDA